MDQAPRSSFIGMVFGGKRADQRRKSRFGGDGPVGEGCPPLEDLLII